MQVVVMQCIVVIVNTYIANTEKKQNIYIATFLFNIANLVMYFLNNDTTTAVIYIVISWFKQLVNVVNNWNSKYENTRYEVRFCIEMTRMKDYLEVSDFHRNYEYKDVLLNKIVESYTFSYVRNKSTDKSTRSKYLRGINRRVYLPYEFI